MAHIRRHPKSANYQVRYRDLSGRERSKTFKRKIDAYRFAATTEADKVRGAWIDPSAGKDTVEEWATRWLDTKRAKEQGTVDSYDSTLRNWVLPRFGHLPIAAIEVDDVIDYVVEMHKAGLSASRVNQGRLVLQGVLDLAVERRRIAHNPVRSRLVRQAQPKIPKKLLRTEDVPTMAEVELLIGAAESRWQGLFVALAYGGLRFGEAAALRAGDLVIGGVYVDEAVKESSTGIALGTVKDHEERFVELPKSIIRRIRTSTGTADRDASDLLFTTSTGGLLSVSSFHNQVWEPTLERAGLEDRKLHVLRAFAASLWLDAGGTIEYVREQLGHADLRTTQKYLSLFRTSRQSILDRLDARLEGHLPDSPVDTSRTPEPLEVVPLAHRA